MANETHLNSSTHHERIEEAAISSLLAGKTTSTRRLVNGKLGTGCVGPPTKGRIMNYWGDELPNLTSIAQKKHIEKAKICINASDKRQVAPSDVKQYRLGIVSYRGSGKYASSTFKWFDELPDCEEVAESWPNWPAGYLLPEGQGWWPVVAMELHDDSEMMWTGPTVGIGKKKILLICFYQLLGCQLIAWWICIEEDQ